jgi:hypothetical protein
VSDVIVVDCPDPAPPGQELPQETTMSAPCTANDVLRDLDHCVSEPYCFFMDRSTLLMLNVRGAALKSW